MKFRSMVTIACDYIMQKPKRFIAGLFLLFLTMISVGMACLMDASSSYQRLSCEKSLRYTVDNVGLCSVELNVNSVENRQKISALISQIEGIDFFDNGAVYLDDSTIWGECSTIQAGRYINNYLEMPDRAVEITRMSEEAWNGYRLQIITGEEPSKVSDESVTPVYLGYQLKDCFEVGTILENKDENGRVYERYLIAGVLQKGSRLIPMSDSIGGVPSGTNTDYMIVVSQKEKSYDWFRFFVKSGSSFEEIREQLMSAAKKVDGKADVVSYFESFCAEKENNRRKSALFLYSGIALAITSLVVLCVCCIMEMMDNVGTISVWYVNGASRNDMACIFWLQRIIMFFPAAGLSFCTLVFIGKRQFDGFQRWSLFQLILRQRVIPIVLLCGVFVSVVSVVVPFLSFLRKQPCEIKNDIGVMTKVSVMGVRDIVVSGILCCIIILVTGMFTFIYAQGRQLEQLNREVTLTGSYSHQVELGLELEWDRYIVNGEIDNNRIMDTAIQFVEFAESLQMYPVGILLFENQLIAQPYRYAMTGICLTNAELPCVLYRGEVSLETAGVYLSRDLIEYLPCADNGQKYVLMNGNNLTVLGEIETKVDEQPAMFLFFSTLSQEQRITMIESILRERVKSFQEPFVIAVGSNDEGTEIMTEALSILENNEYFYIQPLSAENAVESLSDNRDEIQIRLRWKIYVNLLVVVFGVLCMWYVLTLWVQRRKKDYLIMFSFGMSYRRILGKIYWEMTKIYLAGICLVIACGEVIFFVIGKSRMAFLSAIGIVSFCFWMIFMLVVTCNLYQNLRMKNVVSGIKGLRGEE